MGFIQSLKSILIDSASPNRYLCFCTTVPTHGHKTLILQHYLLVENWKTRSQHIKPGEETNGIVHTDTKEEFKGGPQEYFI